MKEIPRAPFLINENINPIWHRWLNDLKTAVDEVRQGVYETITTDRALTQNDLGKTLIFSVGSSALTAALPSVDATDLQKWVNIYRIGTGRLTITAADSDVIETSSRGGSIWCVETKRVAANVTLQLVEVAKWAITAGTGIWKVV